MFEKYAKILLFLIYFNVKDKVSAAWNLFLAYRFIEIIEETIAVGEVKVYMEIVHTHAYKFSIKYWF
jgi:hypothetical protein